MLAASTTWLSAFAQGADVRIVAVIQLTLTGSVEGTNQITLSSGPTAYRGTGIIPPCSIAAIGGLSGEIDPSSLTVGAGQISLEFLDDQALADLFARGIVLKGKTLTLYLATLGMLITDALPLGVFIIDDFRCNGVNAFTLLLKDARVFAETRDIETGPVPAPLPGSGDSTTGFDSRPLANGGNGSGVLLPEYPCRHPLENIVSWLQFIGVPAGQIGASLQASAWAGSIGHFNTSRFSNMRTNGSGPGDGVAFASFDGGVPSSINARDAINQLAQLLGGALFFDPAPDLSSTGEWQLALLAPSGTPVDTWAGPDPDIDEFEIQESWVEIYNALRVTYASNIQGSAHTSWFVASTFRGAPVFEIRDHASVLNLQSLGDSSGIHRFDLSSDWLNGVCPTSGFYSGGTGTPATIGVLLAPAFGVCGCRYDGSTSVPGSSSGWTIPSWALASTSQPVYLRLTGTYFTGTYGDFSTLVFAQEVVRVTAITALRTLGDNRYDGFWTQDSLGHYRPYYLEFTIDQRGLFHTTPVDWAGGAFWNQPIVEDVTIPVFLARSLFTRANYGQVKLRLTTPVQKFPVQVSDLLSVSDPRGAVIGYRNIDPALRWMAIRKEPSIAEGKGNIQWTLSLVQNPSSPSRDDTAIENFFYGLALP